MTRPAKIPPCPVEAACEEEFCGPHCTCPPCGTCPACMHRTAIARGLPPADLEAPPALYPELPPPPALF